MNISVLGSGTWGTAVSVMLANKDMNVRLWSYFEEECREIETIRRHKFLKDVVIPDGIQVSTDMEQIIEGAQIIVLATPSHAIRQTARTLSKFIAEGQVVVNIAKGIEEDSLLTLSQVIREEIPGNPIAVMSGPSHAEEVAMRLPTTNVAASEDIEVARFVQDVFMGENFRIYTSEDVLGVELGGSLKNSIAICTGIIDGIGYGDNAKAAVMTRGIYEIAQLGHAMGAKPETFSGLSGIGDLIVTCTSMHSRNRRAGILIGQGRTVTQAIEEVQMVVEGVRTAKAAHILSQKYGVEMPITKQAYAVLFEGKSPEEAVRDLMGRDKKHENA